MKGGWALLALIVGAAWLPYATAAPQLLPTDSLDSAAFHHETWHQTLDGVPVLDAEVRRHTSLLDPTFVLTEDTTVDTDGIRGGWRLDAAAAVAAATRVVGNGDATVQRVWAPDGSSLVAAYEVQVHDLAPPAWWRVIVDARTGAVLAVEDRLLGIDADARVFLVNPIVALQDPHLRDNPLSVDLGEFENAYTSLRVRGVHDGFGLATDRVNIVDSAYLPYAGDLAFARGDDRFLEVMALAWLEHALDELAALGYPGIGHETIDVWAHSHTDYQGRSRYEGPPNAFVNHPDRIVLFGRPLPGDPGGMGAAAEDAEVLVHELGHIVQLRARGFPRGDAWSHWMEGTADAFSALLLEPVGGGFGTACIGEWASTYGDDMDQAGDLTCYRNLDHDHVWGGNVSDDAYAGGLLLSGALWDLHEDIGRNATLQLLIESFLLVPRDIHDLTTVAVSVLAADRGLTNGTHADAIRAAFAGKGIPLPHQAWENDSADLAPAVIEETPALPVAGVLAGALGVAVVARRRR